MTIDEVIEDAEKIAKECQRVVDTHIVFDDVTIDMLYCDDTEVIDEKLADYQRNAEEYSQIAEWLKELKEIREIMAHCYTTGKNPSWERYEILNKIKNILTRNICQSKLEQSWIPVSSSKELPYDCDLLVTHGESDNAYVGTVYWDMKHWSDNVDDVTAYMRYPKPYHLKDGTSLLMNKEEREDEK